MIGQIYDFHHNRNTTQDQLSQHVSVPVESGHRDPAVYWRSKLPNWRNLCMMVRDCLAIMATSAASERSFSTGRDLQGTSRNCMLPSTMQYVSVSALGIDLIPDGLGKMWKSCSGRERQVCRCLIALIRCSGTSYQNIFSSTRHCYGKKCVHIWYQNNEFRQISSGIVVHHNTTDNSRCYFNTFYSIRLE